jgi:hypothetical protein
VSRLLHTRSRALAAVALGVASFASRSAFASPSTTSIEQGYDLGAIESPRAVAMGGADAALGVSTAALYDNPANLTFARVYHLEALAAFAPEARRQSYGAAAVDSVLNRYRISGGFGGTWSIMDPDGIHRQWTDLRLALAYPLGDRFSVGATVRYLRVDEAASAGPFGASLASGGTSDSPLFNSITLDGGVTLALSDAFRIGGVVKNFNNPGTGVAPLTAGGGIGFSAGEFAVEGDALADFTTYSSTRGRYMLGLEYFAAEHFPLRIGYRYDEGTNTHALSGGLGYVDKQWSIEASGRHDIVGNHPATMIAIALRYFYDAGGPAQDEPDF